MFANQVHDIWSSLHSDVFSPGRSQPAGNPLLPAGGISKEQGKGRNSEASDYGKTPSCRSRTNLAESNHERTKCSKQIVTIISARERNFPTEHEILSAFKSGCKQLKEGWYSTRGIKDEAADMRRSYSRIDFPVSR
jgi:hypothetical protein